MTVGGEEIRRLRKIKGYTQLVLANLIGVSKTTILDWEYNRYFPEGNNLISLAKALEVSASYLLGETDDPAPLIGIVKNKWRTYAKPSGGREPTVEELERHYQRYDIIQIPIYEVAACCGGGIDNEQEEPEAITHIYVDADKVGITTPKQPFGIYASGRSMEPKIYDGDKIIVNPNIEPDKNGGEICFACYLKNGYMRDVIRYYSRKPDNTIILKASSLSGEPDMEFTHKQQMDGELVIVGRVVYVDRGESL